MATETLHGALVQIILSSMWSLEWEAMSWQEVMRSETAGKPDRMMALPSVYSQSKEPLLFFPLSLFLTNG